MPQVEVDGLTINYDVQGEGEPLLLIPYTSADHACYAFQLPAYIEHFSCIAIDLPGSGESDKPAGPYSTDGYADQAATFLGAIGVERAHVAGVSLGAAAGMHLAARHPGRVRSLSLHSGWHASDDYLRIVVERWRALASSLPTVADVVIQAIFPWCFTPEMYVERTEFVDTLADFVRGRPAQPVGAFLAQTDAVIAHDASPGRDPRSDSGHLRSARPRLLHALRRAAQERDCRERAGGLRPFVARRAARGPRDLQPHDARLPAGPPLVTPPSTARRPRRGHLAGIGERHRPGVTHSEPHDCPLGSIVATEILAMVCRVRLEVVGRLFALVAPDFVVVRRAVVAGLVLAAVASAPAGAATLDERLQAVADGLVSDVFVGAGLFGGQQAFYVPGTALTVDLPKRRPRTYVAGRADLRSGRVVRPDDRQPVGSGTKPLTALLVLGLVRRGRIGIDDRLTDVAAAHRRDGGRLARLVAAHRTRLRGITVRQLLNMSSGLRDYDDDPAFGRVFARSPRAPRSMARLAEFGLARPPLFRPGARGRTYYSNTNYVLAGMVVEAVTGRSFASRLRALFRRAGMRRSSYPLGVAPGSVRGYQPPYPGGRTLPPVVRPFLGLPDLGFSVTPRAVLSISTSSLASGPTVGVRPAPPEVRASYGGTRRVVWQDVTGVYRPAAVGSAAGAAVSTSGDLATFWRRLFGGRLVDRATLRLMRSSVPAPPNPPGVRNYFALGMQRQDVARGALFAGSPPLRIWMKLGDIFGYTSASYQVEGPRPYGGVVVTNVTNLFPSPVGDLGVLRDTLRALRG